MTESVNFSAGTVVTSDWLNAVDADRFDYRFNIMDYGAIPNDSSADAKAANDAAFLAVMAAIPNNAAFAPYSGGNTIFIPQGIFYMGATIGIQRQLILRGVTAPDGNGWSGSVLMFPTGVIGIRIYDYRAAPAGTDASGTIIENLTIRTTRNSAAVEGGYHGIYMGTRCTVRNCVVTYFGDCGIIVEATTPAANANNWRIDNVRSAENGFHGFYTDGADVNAGLANRLDCSANLGWGIYDSSFLGNTYIGCHTAGNGSGGYKNDNANGYSLFAGCYTEGEAQDIDSPAIVIGGILGNTTNAGTAPSITAGLGNQLYFNNTDVHPKLGVDFDVTTRSSVTTCMDAYLESSWTPTATNVTTTGSPTYSGTYTRIGNRVMFEITISVSGGTNAFTGNSTYLTLPSGLTPTSLGSCSAVLANTTQVGHCYISTTGRVYLPTWAASNQTVFISGQYPVSTTA